MKVSDDADENASELLSPGKDGAQVALCGSSASGATAAYTLSKRGRRPDRVREHFMPSTLMPKHCVQRCDEQRPAGVEVSFRLLREGTKLATVVCCVPFVGCK